MPEQEVQRLLALRRYSVLDTGPEPAFDELTRLATQICETPIGYITFVDEHRMWIKSWIGLEVREIPRENSFGSYAILQTQPFEVPDASRDERFTKNPYVAGSPHVRFFAGMPLITPDGYAIGTLCVLDTSVRQLSPQQAEALRILSHQVMTQLELRRNLQELARSVEEHKRTEDRLRNSEAFYQTLVDTLPQNILRKDTHGRFTFANKKFCHSIGKPLQEIIGKTDADFFPPELAAKYHRDDERVMSTLENLDTIEAHVTPHGGKLFVHVIKSPLYDAMGRVIGIQGIFWDVTQRKKIEEQLAYERDLLRALLENIPDRIYFKDVESRFVRCSKSMIKRLGLADAKDVVGKTDFDFHDKELAQEFFQDEQRILLTGHPLISKLERQYDSEGQEIWASVTKVPVYNQNGTVTGVIGISRDVTQLKQAEAALEQARDAALESARVKSEFLANMSHEIRTPMNAITGMTGLLRDTALNQEQQEYVATIRDSTETLLNIINDILDYSKIEAGKLSLEVIDFELRDAVESTVEMLADHAQRKNIDLNCWLDPEIPNLLRGDPGRFRQVLANLLSNAVKFTEKGEVLVRVTKIVEEETRVLLRIAVKDTGIGIAPDAIHRIFQSFTQADGSTTRKYGGTGLGLTISKQIVELMEGEIGVESVAGAGSTFWFKVPFQKQPNMGNAEEFKNGNLRGLRVLLLDDQRTQCTILREQLSQWGLQVIGAQTCDEALGLLRQGIAQNQPFHLVLAELQNSTVDGLTFAQHLREHSELTATRLLVLATIGHRISSTVMQSHGISACLVKPVRQSRLYDCLVNLMSAGESAEASSTVSPVPAMGYDQEMCKHLRILLAEDNIVNQRLALRQLKKLGYQAEAVANGKEVIDALQRVPYDVILMDCHMPEVDGYETTYRIRQAELSSANPFKSSPYIVALTANAMQGDREKCLAVGMNDYLTKPVQLGTLANVLQRACQKLAPVSKMETSSAPEVLDPAAIAGLRELREPNEPDPLAELAKLFLEDARNRLAKMAKAFENNDPASLTANAHTLKGSANNMGARHLGSLCAQLEKTAKMGNLVEAANILLEVRGAFQHVERALYDELQKQSAAE